MTRQLRAVLRATINSTFGISAMRWRYFRRRERPWELLAAVFGVVVAGGFFGYTVYGIARAACASGMVFGQPELGLGLAIVSAQALVLFMGFFMVVSAFYFATDLETLVPLPLPPGMIVTAKFITVMIGEYLTLAVIYWPAVVAYAQVAGLGIGQLLVAVLVFLTLPVIPLAIGAAAALFMMRGVSRRQRDIMFYAGSILFLVLVLAWQMTVSQVPESGDIQKYLEELINTRLGLVRALAGRFPPAVWATGAVHQFPTWGGVQYLGLTLGAAAAAIAALAGLGSRLFMRGVLGGSEESSGRRNRGRARSVAALRTAGSGAGSAVLGQTLLRPAATPLRSLALREWQLLSRTPIWMFNNVMPGLIMPVAMFLPLLSQERMRALVDQIKLLPGGATIAGTALAAFLIFVGSVSGVAMTSISREGARIWISRVLPQPVERQLQAKLLVSLIVVAVSAVPTVIGYVLVLRPAIVDVILPAIVGLTGSFAVMTFGLFLDTTRPMLHWTDPQEPVKRNLNAVIPLGLAFALIGVGAGIAAAARAGGWGGTLLYFLLFAVAAVASWASYAVLMRQPEARFAKLEL